MINLTINADTPAQFLETIRRIAAALSGDTATAPAPAATPVVAETVAETKPTTRKKKETPAAETQTETKAEETVETGADSADENVETNEDDNLEEPTKPVEGPKLTLDNVRKFAIKYVNDAESDQEARKTRFQAILKNFGGVAKFQDIPEAKWSEVVAWINAQRVAAKLSEAIVEG